MPTQLVLFSMELVLRRNTGIPSSISSAWLELFFSFCLSFSTLLSDCKTVSGNGHLFGEMPFQKQNVKALSYNDNHSFLGDGIYRIFPSAKI